MYTIKKYSYDQAEKLGVKIRPSNKANFKIDVFDEHGDYITSVGDRRYQDFPSYAESKGIEHAKKRRELYHLRHKNDKGIRGYYALNILW